MFIVKRQIKHYLKLRRSDIYLTSWSGNLEYDEKYVIGLNFENLFLTQSNFHAIIIK